MENRAAMRFLQRKGEDVSGYAHVVNDFDKVLIEEKTKGALKVDF
jgi:hypothetical protein